MYVLSSSRLPHRVNVPCVDIKIMTIAHACSAMQRRILIRILRNRILRIRILGKKLVYIVRTEMGARRGKP